VPESVLQSQISLYPNPVSDILKIENNNGFLIKSIKLYNSLGQLVLEKNEGNQIDVSGLANALYLVEIETDKGVVTKKIMKQ
jgi:hypothetical protein